MKYEIDDEIHDVVKDVVEKLDMKHIKVDRVICFRSHGSKSEETLARIHGLSKIMQKALRTKAIYAIEFISENFDKLDHDEKVKTIIQLLAKQKQEEEIKEKKAIIKLKKDIHPQPQAIIQAKIKKTLSLDAEFSK